MGNIGFNLLYWHSLQEEIWLYFFLLEIVHVRLIAIDKFNESKHYGY